MLGLAFVVSFFLLLAVASWRGWLADSRDHEPHRWFAAPHDAPPWRSG
jgi:hypothetical protein